MFKGFLELSQQDVLDHLMLTAKIAELAEWDNHSHLERITRYTYFLTSAADLGHDEANLISLASILHDVGKIAIPASILKKTANLDPDEYKIAEQHTLEGFRLLDGSTFPIFQAGAVIARTHHERWNGSGYPAGLKGEEIPFSGRVVALADVFDALSTRRPYKTEIHPDEALKLIRKSSGSLFDPKLVSVFVDRFEEIKAVLGAQKG